MFRFTIRDVLWLMAVVGVGTGLSMEHQRNSTLARRLAEVETKRNELQAVFDAMKQRAAKAKADAIFRSSYDGPTPAARMAR
jgi:F0F1-type ATP synthase membrane subunit b/b'